MRDTHSEKTLKIAIVGGTGFDSIEGFDGEQGSIATPYDRVYDKVRGKERVDPVDVERGTIEGVSGIELLLIKRHCSGHTVPASQVNHRANAYAALSWGADLAIGITAVGILDPQIRVGDFVILRDMIRKDQATHPLSYCSGPATVHAAMRAAFDSGLADLLAGACHDVLMEETKNDPQPRDPDQLRGDQIHYRSSDFSLEIALHTNRIAVIINQNDTFSTGAESELYRSAKPAGHVIGMTAYEAVPFAYLGIPYASLALPVDRDNLEGENAVSQAVVDQNVALFKPRVGKIIKRFAQATLDSRGHIADAQDRAMTRLGDSIIAGVVRDSLKDTDRRLYARLIEARTVARRLE